MPQVKFNENTFDDGLEVKAGLNGSIDMYLFADGEVVMKMSMRREAFPRYFAEQIEARGFDMKKQVGFHCELNVPKSYDAEKLAKAMLKLM